MGKQKANYGLDAPGLVRFFLIFGLALFVGGVGLIAWRKNGLLVGIGVAGLWGELNFHGKAEGELRAGCAGAGALLSDFWISAFCWRRRLDCMAEEWAAGGDWLRVR